MTFIQVLNNPQARNIVDQIEDVCASLKGRKDATLEGILTLLVDELYELTGFQYVL